MRFEGNSTVYHKCCGWAGLCSVPVTVALPAQVMASVVTIQMAP